MILTCPNCATRFFVDAQAIGPAGRRVKCDACGTVWMGVSPQLPEPVSEAAPEKVVDGLSAASTAEAAAKSDTESATSPLFAERATARRDAPRRSSGRPWAVGAVILLFLVIAGMVVFRPAIEKAFPGAVSIYQSLGLKDAGASRA